jgi:hypothetical protein
MNGYNDEDLTAFCQFNFEKVFNNFTNGQNKQQKVMALIDYRRISIQLDNLLELLQAENEEQFQQYAPYF